jgi:uncharacterized protein YifN (PemK superfamily)
MDSFVTKDEENADEGNFCCEESFDGITGGRIRKAVVVVIEDGKVNDIVPRTATTRTTKVDDCMNTMIEENPMVVRLTGFLISSG